MKLDISTVEGTLKTLGCYVYTNEKGDKADPRFAMNEGRKFIVALHGVGYALYTTGQLIISTAKRIFYFICDDRENLEKINKKIEVQCTLINIYSLIAGLNQQSGLELLPFLIIQKDSQYRASDLPDIIGKMMPAGYNLLKGIGHHFMGTPSEELMLLYGARRIMAMMKESKMPIISKAST